MPVISSRHRDSHAAEYELIHGPDHATVAFGASPRPRNPRSPQSDGGPHPPGNTRHLNMRAHQSRGGLLQVPTVIAAVVARGLHGDDTYVSSSLADGLVTSQIYVDSAAGTGRELDAG